MNIYEKIEQLKVVPVVVLDDKKDAEPLAKALCDGGLPVAEVTFRTAAARDSIEIMTKSFPEMIVGAGTVLNVEQAKSAIEAGAKFIVSPGFDDAVVDYCLDNEIPVFPGCITPTEIIRAINKGLSIVKFFPAEQFGGISTIKALSAPFTNIKFMPTGGISLSNVKDYLAVKSVIACGGSFMVKKDMVAAGDFEGIKDITRKTVELVNE